MIGDAIAAAATATDLATGWSQAPEMAGSLLSGQVEARTIANILSGEITAMTRRAAELAAAHMTTSGRGAPPVPYCVLVLGSAGRGESLLAADQDNAINFKSGDKGGAADAWFAEMARHMNEILDQSGIPLCKGASWQARTPGVMTWPLGTRSCPDGSGARRPEDLLNVDIFFDAIVVHGDADLAHEVLHRAAQLARQSKDFLMMLTELARTLAAAFWLARDLSQGERPRRLQEVGPDAHFHMRACPRASTWH